MHQPANCALRHYGASEVILQIVVNGRLEHAREVDVAGIPVPIGGPFRRMQSRKVADVTAAIAGDEAPATTAPLVVGSDSADQSAMLKPQPNDRTSQVDSKVEVHAALISVPAEWSSYCGRLNMPTITAFPMTWQSIA